MIVRITALAHISVALLSPIPGEWQSDKMDTGKSGGSKMGSRTNGPTNWAFDGPG